MSDEDSIRIWIWASQSQPRCFFLSSFFNSPLSLSLSLKRQKTNKKKKVYKNNFPKIKIYTQLSSYNSKITLSLFKKFYLFHIFAFQNTSYQIIYFILYFIKILIKNFFFLFLGTQQSFTYILYPNYIKME